jgi:diphthamide synthase subunit DPH2
MKPIVPNNRAYMLSHIFLSEGCIEVILTTQGQRRRLETAQVFYATRIKVHS